MNPSGKGADRSVEIEIFLNYIGQFKVPEEPVIMTEQERLQAEKEAEKLRRKRESNRKYMKKIREQSKEFRERDRIVDIKDDDENKKNVIECNAS